MSDDTSTNLADPASAADAGVAPLLDDDNLANVDDQTDDDAGAADPDDDAGQSDEPELEEVEIDGKKFSIPAALKDSFLRQADYTQKTQKLAEERRALEDQGKTFGEQQKALHQHVLEVSKLVSIDEQLAAYDKVDWNAWNDQDPVAAQKGWFAKEQLKETRNGLGQKLMQEHNDRVTREQQDTAKRIEESQAVIKASIPNWSQEYADKLTEHAKKIVPNATAEQLRQVQLVNPGFVVFLDKAHKYDQIVAKQRASAGQAPTPVTPVTTVGARRAPASNEPRDTDNIDDWRRKRHRQREAAAGGKR